MLDSPVTCLRDAVRQEPEDDKDNMNDLQNYRKQIDEIDRQIVKLIGARLHIVHDIADYKKVHGLPALDAARWQQVLAEKQKIARSFGISTELITDIYELIHKEALRLENLNLNS